MHVPDIESMKLEELEALEASINAEIQSRYYESGTFSGHAYLAMIRGHSLGVV